MGAGADAKPLARAPVDEVVPAFFAWPGVVRDLVGEKAGSLEPVLGQLVEIGLEVVVGQRESAGPMEEVEARAGLDGQLIEAEMAARMVERPFELGRPGLDGLAGAGVDQIERETREQPCGEVDRRERLGRRVLAPEEPERPVIERLDAERDPVDPGRPEAGETTRFDRGRVGLERDLEVLGGGEAGDRAFDHRGDGRGRHQRRRTAAEKDRGEGPRTDLARRALDLGDQRARPAFVVDRRALRGC